MTESLKQKFYSLDVEDAPNIMYCLVSHNLVLGPFANKAEARIRLEEIFDKSGWRISPMWQG